MDNAFSALQDFRSARFKANLQSVLSRLSGQESELLPYEEVRRKLRGVETAVQRREDIPLDAVVGSVGRYGDFNRAFLPLKDSDQDRWVGVKRAMTGLSGVPPIEVYRMGDAYFVKDGNHRVSVARQLGMSHIEAYVTDVATSVPISTDLGLDDLILKSEYADFLERTHLRRYRPEADLSVTVPGEYELLLEHVSVHQYYLGQNEQRPVGFEEAAVHWYDTVYLPVAELVKTSDLLQDFPGRTAADLYLWLSRYRAELETSLGWTLTPQSVTTGLKEDLAPRAREQRVLSRVRNEKPTTYLAQDILVAVSGAEAGWAAVEQALVIAQREHGRLYGLHVVASAEAGRSAAALGVKERFEQRCREADVQGQLALEIGNVAAVLGERARWVNLVVASLRYPPSASVSAGLRTGVTLDRGFQSVLRRVHRPVLAVPGPARVPSKVLLAYNQTPRADIALFASTYLALRWNLSLSVVAVVEGDRTGQRTLSPARAYLEKHGVQAHYLVEDGPVAPALLATQASEHADLLVMGSYEYSPVLEPLLGGVLDEVLRGATVPVLVCQ